MPLLYRGAAVGTYWHAHDGTTTGFVAQSPGMTPSLNVLMLHIARTTTFSPYISLTWSLGIARDYAIVGPGGIATQNNPGYIYLIDIPNTLPAHLQILDPIKEIAGAIPPPPNPIPYQHEGAQDFLLGVVNPTQYGHLLTAYYLSASNSPATRPTSPSLHLETLVRALRDAEVLAYGIIPANYVLNRIPVW